MPIFTCPQKNDAFTVEDTTKGNGALTYPVGLITADEVVAAGSGKLGTANDHYYLYRSSSYNSWTLSSLYYTTAYSSAGVFWIIPNGALRGHHVNQTSGAAAPVINLSAEYVSTMVGMGTMIDPYRAE